MISDVCLVDPVAWVRAELSGESDQLEVVPDRDAELVEQHVVVRAKAQDVLGDVRPVVGPPERADVGSFGIGAAGRVELLAAHLAAVFMEPLHSLCHCRNPNDALDTFIAARSGVIKLLLFPNAVWLTDLERNKAELIDPESCSPLGWPV